MIKEQEACLLTAELCLKHGLSPAMFYKLKRVVADVILDNVILKAILAKP